jgi:Mn2+/Fe2+ NRAMP family transporter
MQGVGFVVVFLFGFLAMLSGFAALRRPVDKLIEHDPIGKYILQRRGPVVTRWAYRIFGIIMCASGFAAIWLALSNR